jgi:hypothetical protein
MNLKTKREPLQAKHSLYKINAFEMLVFTMIVFYFCSSYYWIKKKKKKKKIDKSSKTWPFSLAFT